MLKLLYKKKSRGVVPLTIITQNLFNLSHLFLFNYSIIMLKNNFYNINFLISIIHKIFICLFFFFCIFLLQDNYILLQFFFLFTSRVEFFALFITQTYNYFIQSLQLFGAVVIIWVVVLLTIIIQIFFYLSCLFLFNCLVTVLFINLIFLMYLQNIYKTYIGMINFLIWNLGFFNYCFIYIYYIINRFFIYFQFNINSYLYISC